MHEIIKNYSNIINQIDYFNKKFSKTSKSPKLVVVSKTFAMEKIKLVIQHGHKVLGENKVQEANEKWRNMKEKNKEIELHLIGPLQSNKVKTALETFDIIQTIDREKVVKRIRDFIDSSQSKKNYEFFAQVNIGKESQKSGVEIQEVSEFVKWCRNDMNLNLTGLMCIPPLNDEPSIYFSLLRNLCDKNNLKNASMGMSDDYEKAIQFGATHLRIGSGVFGPRN